jgi:transcriptional regulator with GAF, ATPase, and Fis domain
MTAPPSDTTTDLHAALAALRAERDAALSEKAALAEALATRTAELATRNSEYGQRIEQQAGTVGDAEALAVEIQELRAAQAAGLEVLQAMIASPGDTQPVFDLIAQEAAKLCEVPIAVVARFDGAMIHLVTHTGMEPADAEVLDKQFPRPPSGDIALGRAILGRRIEQIEDLTADPDRAFTPPPGQGSVLAVPLLRDGAPLGAIAIGRQVRGPFSRNQITLLQTFAEQAVIAITSAETYRALQTRTSDLQQSLEYQTATSDVLNVISRSTFDLQPVLETVVETAAAFVKPIRSRSSAARATYGGQSRISGSHRNTWRTTDRAGEVDMVKTCQASQRELCGRRSPCIFMMWRPFRAIRPRRSGWASSGPRLVFPCFAKVR